MKRLQAFLTALFFAGVGAAVIWSSCNAPVVQRTWHGAILKVDDAIPKAKRVPTAAELKRAQEIWREKKFDGGGVSSITPPAPPLQGGEIK